MSKIIQNTLDWRQWLKGAIGGFIQSAATSITACVVSPSEFNLDGGFTKLAQLTLVSGIVGAALFLKTHPVPDDIKPAHQEPKP